MKGWQLQYDGDNTKLSVEEFIFRVESLTGRSLQGDFALLMDNFHTLLAKKVSGWYWTLLRTNPYPSWEIVKAALRTDWSDHLRDIDIRNKMSVRRQRPDERFADYFQDLHRLRAQLQRQMPESDFVETVKAGLLPSYQPLLCLRDTSSLDSLKALVIELELARLRTNSRWQRAHVEEVQTEQDQSSQHYRQFPDFFEGVEAVSTGRSGTICWNCDRPGHFYTECLEPPQGVFCYGCGKKGVYKPQCPACSTKNPRRVENTTNSSRPGPARTQQAVSTPTAPPTTRS